MDIFLTLLFKLIPLYLVIFLGFLAGRYLDVKKEPIVSILIYILIPIVVFDGISKININPGTLSIPFLFFALSLSVSLITYFILGILMKDKGRNILALTSGSSNIGYFGLPVAISIFGDRAIGIVALAIIGISIYHNSFGLFLAAKGSFTTKESILKVLKLPVLYVFILGLIINMLDVNFGNVYSEFIDRFHGAYVILGMMLIGIAIGECKSIAYDYKFLLTSFIAKFVIWPALMLSLIVIDQKLFHIYDPGIYKILILLSIVPIAANMVSYATLLNAYPKKISFIVIVNTLFALFYIPLIVALFF